MSKKTKLLLFGGGALALIIVIVLNFTMGGEKKTTVNSQTVSQRDLTEMVSASGRIQPKTKVNITSQVNGEIRALPVREGDTVKAGQLLIVLDTVQLRSDLDQAFFAMNEINAVLAGAKTSLDQSEEEYNRQKSLWENGKLTAEVSYNNAKYAYQSARSSYEATQASAKQAQSRYDKQLDNLKKAKITAPMDGIVTLVDCEVGEIAAAQTAFTQGKTLLTIANLDVYEVEVEVDETEVGKIGAGQPVKIEVDACPDTAFTGTVAEIGNTAIFKGLGTQDQSTNFKVKVEFHEASSKIRPGMSATVDITTNKREKVLSVPYSAVVVRSFDLDSLKKAREGKPTESAGTGGVQAAESTSDTVAKPGQNRKELKGVFLIKNGKAEFVEVQTGIADQKNIEVLSGVQSGDSVISGPYRVLRTIKNGDLVNAQKEMGAEGREDRS
ncbi:hypothetical protein C3F09_07235 [candidate division GN15 bacterium]|uniref:Efflux RND transporter periplasmic adaptor subunit n=1 Tax=candidate division GN15 bacterium TaxID=2072418 RepID=A0A855X5I4_9BACT|nr:MAG: hypothetical protein C3F09_07235 [candidate division GN15 bacterium]